MVKRDQPENGLDVSIDNKDDKVLVTNVFEDLKEKVVILRDQIS